MAALAVILGLVASVAPAWADAGEPPEVEAQRLVHILGYTAADYGGAVANGAVVNATEYEEQIALLTDAAKIAARIQAHIPSVDDGGSPGKPGSAPKPPGQGAPPDLAAGVAKVRVLVDAKAGDAQVAAAVEEVRTSVTNAFRLSEAPPGPPDPARAKALFAEHCATCHGATGHADTARAKTLDPHPADFHDPRVADALTPLRVASTVRFGINGTSMAPFDFLSDADRWALAFHVLGLRHAAEPASGAPTFTLAELAIRSDAQLRDDLRAAGFPDAKIEGLLTDLRTRAPYEDRAGKSPLSLARTRLDRAKVAAARGEYAVARASLVDAYLEGIEPAEGPLRATDNALVTSIEAKFLTVRARLEAGAPAAEVDAGIAALLADVNRAEMLLAAAAEHPSFLSTAVSSGGILLREGVEAALLVAALLGIASQAGLGDRRRWVHLGWGSALALGAVTFLLSSRVVAISGARRELIEGVTALLATLVLFYVSYSLLAKKEVARWMRFLRAHVSPRRAAASLFGVSFLAAYREAFETVLFYQALLSSKAPAGAALAGAAVGGVILVLLVVAYTRAGKFAPPQVFFRISSYLLYALAVVFAGQGIAALQLTGAVSIHPLPVPSVPALGLHPTVETTAAQALLLALALVAFLLNRRSADKPAPPAAAPKPVTH